MEGLADFYLKYKKVVDFYFPHILVQYKGKYSLLMEER